MKFRLCHKTNCFVMKYVCVHGTVWWNLLQFTIKVTSSSFLTSAERDKGWEGNIYIEFNFHQFQSGLGKKLWLLCVCNVKPLLKDRPCHSKVERYLTVCTLLYWLACRLLIVSKNIEIVLVCNLAVLSCITQKNTLFHRCYHHHNYFSGSAP